MTWTPLDTALVVLGVALAALATWTLVSAHKASRFRELRTAIATLVIVLALVAVAVVVINAMIPPIT